MSFFKKNEHRIVKSGIYGFILGLFTGILFISKTEVIRTAQNTKIFNNLTIFEYTIKLLRISILFSICLMIITIIYFYTRERKDNW